MRSFLRSFLGFALLTGPCLLGIFHEFVPLPVLIQAVVGVLCLIALAILLRRPTAEIFGPVFFYDLVRTARRGQTVTYRCFYTILLLLMMFLVYLSWAPRFGPDILFEDLHLSISQRARFAESFFLGFLIVQFGAVGLLTPIYTAGAIAGERERRTLEFLLTTELNDREIVLGMLGARMANLLLILMAGLPVLSLLELLGGIEPMLVLVGFAATVLLTLSIGSLSILASVHARTSLQAVLSAYGFTVLGLLGSSFVPGLQCGNPFFIVVFMGPAREAGGGWFFLAGFLGFMVIHVIIIFACAQQAVSKLRAAALEPGVSMSVPRSPAIMRSAATPPKVRAEEGEALWVMDLEPPLAAVPQPVLSAPIVLQEPAWLLLRPRPPIGDNALLWKELYAEGDGSMLRWEPGVPPPWFFLIALPVTIILLVTSLAAYFTATEPAKFINLWVRGVGAVVGACLFLLVALSAAGRISRERERQTLESLLLLPEERGAVIFAKWLGSLLRARWLALYLAGIWIFGVLTGGVSPAALPLVLAAAFVYAVFLAALGLWLSSVYQTTLRANLFTLLITLLIVIGPGFFLRAGLIPVAYYRGPAVISWELVVADAVSPTLTLWHLSFRGDELTDPKNPAAVVNILAAVAGLHIYLLLAVFLWRQACTRLRAEQGPAPRPSGRRQFLSTFRPTPAQEESV